MGSSWLNFTDFMIQVKARMERETEDSAAPELGADLEGTADSAPQPTTPSGKSKKKKKKAKKKASSAADLDLDMDNDDAAMQTRFANIVKTDGDQPKDQEQPAAASDSPQASPKASLKRRKSKRNDGLGTLQEVVEGEEDEDESSSEEEKKDGDSD